MNLSTAGDEQLVIQLYYDLLEQWNQQQAAAMAALLTPDGSMVGFDGSQMNGAEQVKNELSQIFKDHPTALYVGIVREVRFLTPGVALLRAVAGMVPRGKKEINPAVNAIQSLVALQQQDSWRVALFHNTPAAFHGRPELSKQLTDELQRVVDGLTS